MLCNVRSHCNKPTLQRIAPTHCNLKKAPHKAVKTQESKLKNKKTKTKNKPWSSGIQLLQRGKLKKKQLDFTQVEKRGNI